MIDFNKVIDVTQWLNLPKINYQKSHIESRCPFCGDSKTKKRVTRFHIDFYAPYNTYIYKCHRCGESGNIISLYSYFAGVSYKEAYRFLSNTKYDPSVALKTLNGYKEETKQDVDKDLDINIDEECYSDSYIPTSNFELKLIQKLWNFRIDRKIPNSLPLYIAHSGNYSGRIIIPIFIDNKMVYFQGRALYDDVIPKYLNPKVEKSDVILNIDKFEKDKWIVITEGTLDAYSLNNNQGTCVIGGYIDINFINTVMTYTKKGVIICLDNYKKDDNSLNVLKKLINENINRYSNNIKFFNMPDGYDAKDLNQLAVNYDIDDLYTFILENSISILKMKMLLHLHNERS